MGIMREKRKVSIGWDRTWQWIAKGDLKRCTEALLYVEPRNKL